MNKSKALGLRSAFTLIELLVVITIMAILFGLLIPLLAHAKSAAWSAHCKGNLRQAGIGLILYLNDHQVYPRTRGPWGPGEVTYREWTPLLEPSAGPRKQRRNASVLSCPSPEGTRYRSGSQLVTIPQSYGYNHNGYENGVGAEKLLGLGGRSLYEPTPETEVVAPSNMIAIGDGTINGPANAVAASDIGFRRIENMTWGGDFRGGILRAQKRHRRKVNVTFCDGHVEAFTLQELFLEKSDKALRRWNRDNEPHR